MSSSGIYLTGPLFAQPEIGRTSGNEPSVKILLLSDLVRKKGPELYQVETTVLPISCYGELAAQAACFRSGDRVVIRGHLFGTSFKPPDESIRRGIQFRADEFLFPRRSAWPDSVRPIAHTP
jgi:single-stranded DNA-binding protein